MVEYYLRTRRENLMFPPLSLTQTERHTQSLHDAPWRNSLSDLSFFELRKILTFPIHSSGISMRNNKIYQQNWHINYFHVYENIWTKSILHGKFKAFNYLCIKLLLWIHTIKEIRRALFWFRVEKQTNQSGQHNTAAILFCNKVRYVWRHLTYRGILLALHHSSFVVSSVELPCWLEVFNILEAKICLNYRDQSNITPCLGSFVKVLKAVKHNAMSSNKACNCHYDLSWALDSAEKT